MRRPDEVAYRLGRVLGAGGFGITYLAWDVTRNVRVAIKEYIPREIVGRSGGSAIIRLHTQRDAAAFQAGLTRFVQEADALRQFRHPNIVNVLDFVKSNDTAYLVMPFYVGRTLGQYLDEQKRMEPAAALPLILSILDGLRHVHEKHLGGRRWMHRDVKPDNVFVRSDDTPLLIDFGAARTEIGAASRSMSRMYTPGYAPYEQIILGPEHQGPWIDVYATAATLYHTITGEPPADAPQRYFAVQSGKPDPLVRPRDLVPDLPEDLEDAILTGMAVDYQHRPQDAGDLQQLLEGAKQVLPRRKTAIFPGSSDRPAARRTSIGRTDSLVSRKVLLGVGLAAIVVIATAGSAMLWSTRGSGSSDSAQSPPAPIGNTAAQAGTAPPPAEIEVRPIETPAPGARIEGAPPPPNVTTADSQPAVEQTIFNPAPPLSQPRPDTATNPGGAAAAPLSTPDETTVVVAYQKGNPGLRYRLMQRLESGREVEVDPETIFHSGDNVRFVFESNIEGHLYIVQRGSSGNWTVLFPNPRINGGQHVIRPREPYTVPSTDGWFRFDDKPGDESVRVFLSKQPLDSFPGLQQAVAKPQTVEDIQVARAVLKSRELVLVQIPADKTPAGGTEAGNYGVSTDAGTDTITISIKLIHR